MDIMALRRQTIEASQPHYVTASGEALRINPGAKKVSKLKVTFAPVQSGSGTPSPSNVRPISGWSTISVTLGDTSASVSLGSTYYGGTVDLVSGVLTVTHKCLTLVGDNFSVFYSSYERPRVSLKSSLISDVWTGDTNPQGVVMCDKARTYPNDMTFTGDNSVIPYCTMGSTMNFVFPESYNITSLSDAQTWINNNNITCVFCLKTPVSYQLDPQTINTLRCQQTVSSPAGDIEIGFWANDDTVTHLSYSGIPVYRDNAYFAGSGTLADYGTNSGWFIAGPFDTGSSDRKTYTYTRSTSFPNAHRAVWRTYNDPSGGTYDYVNVSDSSGPSATTASVGGRYVYVSVKRSDADNAYMYVTVNGVNTYLFKGKNVT